MNVSRTLEQLEASPWPSPPPDSSPMVIRLHALRKVPIGKLSAGDCRLLIGQEVGHKHLASQALLFLEAEPLIEGDHYPGDLLVSLMRLPAAFWVLNASDHKRLRSVAQQASQKLGLLTDPTGSDLKLQKEINAFLANNGSA